MRRVFVSQRSAPWPHSRGGSGLRFRSTTGFAARISCAVASTLVFLCVAAHLRAEDNAAPAATVPLDELIATVVAGTAHNDELLGMVQAEIEDEMLQPGVAETKRFTYKTPDGGVFEYTMTPRAVVQRRFIVQGANVRQEHFDDDGNISQYFVVRQDRSIQYVPASKIAWIRPPGDAASDQAFDPREFGNEDVTRTLAAILREDQILEAGLVNGPSGSPLARFVVQGPGTKRFLWELDPAHSFLPVRTAYYHADGKSMNVTTQISYQQVPARSAWFLRESVRRIYGPGKATAFDAPGWIAQTTSKVKRVVPLDKKQHAEAFEVALPLGVKVYDGLAHDTYVLGQERSGTLGPWTRTFMIGLAALAACAVVAGCVRFFRSRMA